MATAIETNPPRLAQRLGMTTHQSPLRYKIRSLMAQFPTADAPGIGIEEWLVDVANSRGARVIARRANSKSLAALSYPPRERFSNAELIVACCQPNCVDHPQLLRPAAQLVSRGDVDLDTLIRLARQERAGRILAELARQALKVDAGHPVWSRLDEVFREERPLRDAIIHWTRLAEPIMEPGKPNAQGWRLVS